MVMKIESPDYEFGNDEYFPALVVPADYSEPVELTETDEPASVPPQDWASNLDEADWQERLSLVEISEHPDDDRPGSA